MPATTTCTRCGFHGDHGFTICGPMGIVHFYHGPACNGSICGYYGVAGKDFASRADAWRAIRNRYADDTWRQAWDAELLENKPRKAKRLFKVWNKKGGP